MWNVFDLFNKLICTTYTTTMILYCEKQIISNHKNVVYVVWIMDDVEDDLV